MDLGAQLFTIYINDLDMGNMYNVKLSNVDIPKLGDSVDCEEGAWTLQGNIDNGHEHCRNTIWSFTLLKVECSLNYEICGSLHMSPEPIPSKNSH